jgi:hypothetical protein
MTMITTKITDAYNVDVGVLFTTRFRPLQERCTMYVKQRLQVLWRVEDDNVKNVDSSCEG